jgi:hypothetical protein
MNARTCFLLGIGLLLSASSASAQPKQPASTFTLGQGTVDLAVPESPAFGALGLTPKQVARPTTARELAMSFINGIDRSGNLQTGIAVDTAPYMLLAGSRITLQDYQRPGQYLTRFLARWQVSFATAKGGSEDDPSAKIALGLRFTLLDKGDPRTDAMLVTCLSREAANMLNRQPPVPPTLSDEELAIENQRREELVREGVRPCREDAARRRWNRTAWIAGLAPTWTSADGTASQTDYSGTALWTSIGFGFEDVPVLEDHAMLALLLRSRDGETAADQLAPGSFITQDSANVGLRFIFGSPTTQFNVETLWVRNDRVDLREDRYWNLSFAFERRLINNIWLDLSFGRQLAREASASEYSIVSAFNWGLGDR